MKNKDIHGGNPEAIAGSNVPVEIIYDFSVNLNPLGPPPEVDKLLLRATDMISGYPPIAPVKAEKALAEAHGTTYDKIVLGNGATELFSLLLQGLGVKSACISTPAYSGYAEICEQLNIPYSDVSSTEERGFMPDFDALSVHEAELIFLCSPTNPTGAVVDPLKILEFVKRNPKKYIVLDESFIDFAVACNRKTLCGKDIPENLIVIKSLTKFFSVAGLRLGILYSTSEIAAKIKAKQLIWSVNAIAQEAAAILYKDKKYIQETVTTIANYREKETISLDSYKQIKVFPADSNFILCKLVDTSINADQLQKRLLEKGIFIRSCTRMTGLGEHFFRVAVRPLDEQEALFEAINPIFNTKTTSNDTSKKRPVMIVGTTSNSGKSLINAAFCRYFSNCGEKVAPFKAQNMSLNSFVTKEGGEMGRAQVVQSRAARIEPHTDMNPVLLKPLGDSRSQVIVDGHPIGNFVPRGYYSEKNNISEKAFAAFDRLASRYDRIVLEGAGSPAEINLLDDDFVNMRMAEYANADTILVADIDRGGVFATILGTIKLIPIKWRKFIKGIIINKFRGDASLLDSGIEEIEKLTGIPILGVIPFIPNLCMEEEDSLGLETRNKSALSCATLDVAVIRLPRMSNYTDLLALEATPDVSVRYVENPRKLGEPDLIIVPGTKNTINDMLFLRSSGFENRLIALKDRGALIVGICGGYQMLGTTIKDPYKIEGDTPEVGGLGFLEMETVLEEKKELAQVSGETSKDFPFAEPGTAVEGYEIHVGVSKELKDSGKELINIESRHGENCNKNAGTISEDGNIFGCYIHGIFDSEEFRKQFLDHLFTRKGIERGEITVDDIKEAEETSFELLAQTLEECCDLTGIS